MVRAVAVTAMEHARVAVLDFASVALTTKSEDPIVPAAPVTVPVWAFNAMPAGNAPEEIAHAIGASPPAVDSDDEYGSPTATVGVGQAAIANPFPTVRSNCFSS